MTSHFETNPTDASHAARSGFYPRLFGPLVLSNQTKHFARPNPLVVQGLHIS